MRGDYMAFSDVVVTFSLSFIMGMVIFALTISFFYAIYRVRYLKYMAAYWWLLVLAYTALFLAFRFDLMIFLTPYYWLLFLAIVSLIMGFLIYTETGFNKRFKHVIIGFTGVFFILPVLYNFPLVYTTSVFITYAILMSYASVIIAKQEGLIHKIISAILLLLALNTFVYPFLALDGRFAYISLIISALFGSILGITLIVMHLLLVQSKTKETHNALLYKSYHDAMTNLYNRAYFDEAMQKYNNNPVLPMALMLCDLNTLKKVNDQYGHFYGDQMIKNVANVLLDYTSKHDKVIRYGGDEFVLFLPYKNHKEALDLKQTFLDVIKTIKVHDVAIKLAIGVASKKDINEPMQSLFNRAEAMMYDDKAKGDSL
jgi:diguanylate cyclase (GGDEF)-like protein